MAHEALPFRISMIGILPATNAKATIRAAVRYLLRGATGGARGDIVHGIITIVRQIANEPPRGKPDDPLDDDMPGG
jgi:hypothetical protein